MTDEKQTGAALAAKEITVLAARNITAAGMHSITCTDAWTAEAIEAIILKYCSDNKGAEELLATACYLAKGFVYVICQDRNQDPNDTEIYRSICAALAEYEKVNK